MSHATARLAVFGRQLVVERVQGGWSAAAAAEAAGISRATVYKCLRRHRGEGEAGLADRSSRPQSRLRWLPPSMEERGSSGCRRKDKLGSHRLANRVGLPRSTCHRLLPRHQDASAGSLRPAQRPGDPAI